jgi:hypothetical protein
MDYNDGISIVGAIERSLSRLGYALELGSGVKGFQEVLMEYL